jgi:hypothetical protein
MAGVPDRASVRASSEPHAEDWYRRTALDDLLGIPAEQVNDDRLYRALDRLLPHKEAIEVHLYGLELFELEYDPLLYDDEHLLRGLAQSSGPAAPAVTTVLTASRSASRWW